MVYLLLVLFVMTTFGAATIGTIEGNKEIQKKYNKSYGFLGLAWIIGKLSIVLCILLIIILEIANNFLESNIWSILICLVFGAMIYLKAKSKVKEEWEIDLKVTKELKRKLEAIKLKQEIE